MKEIQANASISHHIFLHPFLKHKHPWVDSLGVSHFHLTRLIKIVKL
jgi:hypothetical protein